MTANRKTVAGAIVAVALLLAIFAFSMTSQPPVYVQAAGITPVGGNEPAGSKVGPLIPIVTAVVTADGRVCRDTREYTIGDVQLVLEPNSTPVNMTVMLEHSNNNVNYTDGPQVVATQSATTDVMNRYDLYGVYTCINWDIATASTTNTVDLSVYLLPRN